MAHLSTSTGTDMLLPCPLMTQQVNFVDLRPIPADVKPLSRDQFAVLLSCLVNSPALNASDLSAAVDDVAVETKVNVMGR